jgi:hypothetical protein
MTRFEIVAASLILTVLALVHGPAFGQYIVIDGASGSAVKQATTDPKNGKAAKGPRARATSTPAEPPKPVEPTFTVTGGFEKTKDLARESAIRAAVDKLQDYLMEQNPPITQKPSTKFVRKLLLDQQETVKDTDETILTGNGNAEKMYQVTVALKVEPSHIRELRSQDRSSEALWVLAGMGGLAAMMAGFFRVDAWTKGYLTSWLVLGTVGAASLLAGLWWWAK